MFHHGAVAVGELSTRVRQQLECQSLFRAKALVRFRGIDTNAENDCLHRLVLVQVLLKVMRLERTTWRRIFRIKIKHNPLAAKILERSEEHTSELQSRLHLVCRLLLEKKKKKYIDIMT